MPRAGLPPSDFLLAPMVGASLLLAAILVLPPWAHAEDAVPHAMHGAGVMQVHGAKSMETSASPEEAAFLLENDAAMTKMMVGLAMKPSGNVDRDFVEMMIPHHQGAIDMAQAALRYTRNEQLRRLAQEIIVTQQQEIAAMRLAVGDPLPAVQAAPTQIAPTAAR